MIEQRFEQSFSLGSHTDKLPIDMDKRDAGGGVGRPCGRHAHESIDTGRVDLECQVEFPERSRYDPVEFMMPCSAVDARVSTFAMILASESPTAFFLEHDRQLPRACLLVSCLHAVDASNAPRKTDPVWTR